MKPELQIKALAELDGWTDFVNSLDNSSGLGGTPPDWDSIRYQPCKEYLTSYDAIIPLIQKQSVVIIEELANRARQRHRNKWWFQFTPAELAEDLLRATGKWIE